MLTIDAIYLLLPEVVLILTATLVYLGGAFAPSRSGWEWLSAAGLLLAAALLAQQTVGPDRGAFVGPLVIDLFSLSLRWLILGVGLVFVMLSARSAPRGLASEYLGSLLLIVAGMMLVGLANNLVLLFLALELISIPTYVVLYLGRGDAGSQEAATKYFFLSILSSALLLYGFSFLYGATGSIELAEIYQVLLARPADAEGMLTFARLALVLVVAGLGFRITAVPFHFYAPDVYQGTTHPNAGLLSVVPKIAGLVALVRIVAVGMPGVEEIGWHLTLPIAVLTMTVGNLLALWQNNIRRMLAYSSIAHAGYMLIGLAVAFAVTGRIDAAGQASSMDAIGAMMFYLVVYSMATVGAFAALTYWGSENRQIDGVDELAGIGRTHPASALAMAIFMFSLTGLPPLAGFWGKFNLFLAALGVGDALDSGAGGRVWLWFVGLAIAGVLNAAISAAYYLRVIAVMYFRSSLAIPAAQGGPGAAIVMVLCTLLVVGVGVVPGPWIVQANQASQSARATFLQLIDEERPVAASGQASQLPQSLGSVDRQMPSAVSAGQ